jgi:D-tagatose-1,6-bisphosphate aldolase subunit GatZ/KbaZ
MDTPHDLPTAGGLTHAVELLPELVAANLAGARAGLPSICSAERFVLEAAVSQALRDDTILCVESTCNQVNQYGGYTGMTPADFQAHLEAIAVKPGLASSRLIVGGDHLGPYPWRHEAAAAAMAKAAELVRACVLAGYTKIHLDASMRLDGDPGDDDAALDERIATRRTTDLCRVAEEARRELPESFPAPVYVVGTEVPAPGGERTGDELVAVTTVAEAERTLALTRAAFADAGLDDAWRRVVALVVQPGVEFGDQVVHEYDPRAAAALSAFVAGRRPLGPAGHPLVFEAHSTDYQTPASLARLVEDHFAILKVGPALTFAVREALFALEEIERELLAGCRGFEPSRLRATLDRAMVAWPDHWRPYHGGDERMLALARAFSYSDRARYYWAEPRVRDAVARLMDNLGHAAIPPPLLSQYLPLEYAAVRDGDDVSGPADLIRRHVVRVIDTYAGACGPRADGRAAHMPEPAPRAPTEPA